eukprot:CAMPEP_0177537628 /NCGR_PEP_ID=MMETSP0369-20130122/57885_1 /TAXON_ID=447022 ORGANISM="Scrippsiella hangoei-like, Strain SHHI-4" /NCGR_SAMPLE_ID=MMETSP0369 /ASSEMBLY_ACC=CAM_ASM_000364 /LENGTH=64 /DNA_ID=CAMNT_0019020265 /DNA_START=52 /DNA_END=246 /DNA_ORIENTATION=+
MKADAAWMAPRTSLFLHTAGRQRPTSPEMGMIPQLCKVATKNFVLIRPLVWSSTLMQTEYLPRS